MTKQGGEKHYVAVAFLAVLLMNATGLAEESLQIRLNTIGYTPSAGKKAVVAGTATNFFVVRVADGARMFSGRGSGIAE